MLHKREGINREKRGKANWWSVRIICKRERFCWSSLRQRHSFAALFHHWDLDQIILSEMPRANSSPLLYIISWKCIPTSLLIAWIHFYRRACDHLETWSEKLYSHFRQDNLSLCIEAHITQQLVGIFLPLSHRSATKFSCRMWKFNEFLLFQAEETKTWLQNLTTLTNLEYFSTRPLRRFASEIPPERSAIMKVVYIASIGMA